MSLQTRRIPIYGNGHAHAENVSASEESLPISGYESDQNASMNSVLSDSQHIVRSRVNFFESLQPFRSNHMHASTGILDEISQNPQPSERMPFGASLQNVYLRHNAFSQRFIQYEETRSGTCHVREQYNPSQGIDSRNKVSTSVQTNSTLLGTENGSTYPNSTTDESTAVEPGTDTNVLPNSREDTLDPFQKNRTPFQEEIPVAASTPKDHRSPPQTQTSVLSTPAEVGEGYTRRTLEMPQERSSTWPFSSLCETARSAERNLNVNYIHVENNSGIQVNLPSEENLDSTAGSERQVPRNIMVHQTAIEKEIITRCRNVTDYSKHILETHERERLYVRTRAFDAVMDKLRNGHRIVILMGCSGYGLTAMGREILCVQSSKMLGSKALKPVIIHNPQTWHDCVNVNDKMIIFIDDMFGSNEFETALYTSWQRLFHLIHDKTQGKNSIVIIALKKSVFEEAFRSIKGKDFGIFHQRNIVDLTSQEFRLNTEEQRCILIRQLSVAKSKTSMSSQEQTTIEETVSHLDLSQAPFGFPRYANSFASSEFNCKMGSAFFSNPDPFLFHVIERMRLSHDVLQREKFLALAATTVTNNNLDVIDVRNTSVLSVGKMRSKLRKRFFSCGSSSAFPQQHREESQTCGTKACTSHYSPLEKAATSLHLASMTANEIKRGALHLQGTLLSTKDNVTYRFAGKSIQRAVEISYGQMDPEFIVGHCDLHFLVHYVRPKPLNVTGGLEMALEIDEGDTKTAKIVVRRLTDFALMGHVREFATHPLLGEEWFANVFFEEYSDRKIMIKLVTTKDKVTSNGFIYHCLDQPTPIALRILHLIKWKRLLAGTRRSVDDLPKQEWLHLQNQNMLLRSTEIGEENVYRYLKKLVVVGRTIGNKCLLRACKVGNTEIVLDLLSSFRCTSEDITNALKATCEKYNNADESMKGFLKCIVQFLLSYMIDVISRTQAELALLLQASRDNHSELAKMLLDVGAPVNSKDAQVVTSPLHVAAESGSLEVVEVLLSRGAFVNISDKHGRLPIHYAAEKGNALITFKLIEYGSGVNTKDSHGRMPHCLAAENRHQTVTEVLEYSMLGQIQRTHNLNRNTEVENASGSQEAIDINQELKKELDTLIL